MFFILIYMYKEWFIAFKAHLIILSNEICAIKISIINQYYSMEHLHWITFLSLLTLPPPQQHTLITTTITAASDAHVFKLWRFLCAYRAFPVMKITIHKAGPGFQGTCTLALVCLSSIWAKASQSTFLGVIRIAMNSHDSLALTEKRKQWSIDINILSSL